MSFLFSKKEAISRKEGVKNTGEELFDGERSPSRDYSLEFSWKRLALDGRRRNTTNRDKFIYVGVEIGRGERS